MEARRGETGRGLARLDAKHDSPARSRQAKGLAQCGLLIMGEKQQAIVTRRSRPRRGLQPKRAARAGLNALKENAELWVSNVEMTRPAKR